MSVVVRGMKMPKSCDECGFRYGAWCLALDNWRKAYNKPPTGERLDECPLVELPPHGRLIDADAAKAHFKDEGMRVSKLTVMAVLNNAPTIIEAEEVSE